MEQINHFKELKAWQKAVQASIRVYQITRSFPKEEVYSLTDQVRRSAVSVASNIAEGNARNSSKEYLHFLSIARGSIAELYTQILIARELGYLTAIDADGINAQFDEVGRMINSISKKVTLRDK